MKPVSSFPSLQTSHSNSPSKKQSNKILGKLSTIVRPIPKVETSQSIALTNSLILDKEKATILESNQGQDEKSFQKFFKFTQEKKFIKQGKTPDVSKSLQQKKKSLIPPQGIEEGKPQCPFMDKSTWMVPSKKPNKIGDTLLERIGAERFSNILKTLLSKVLKHPKMAQYFKNRNVEKITEGLTFVLFKQLSQHNPSLESLSVSLQNNHKDLKITNEAFDIFKGYFALSFRELEVDEEVTAEFLRFLEGGRKHIVVEKNAFELAVAIFKDKMLLTEKIAEKIESNSLLNGFFEGWDRQKHRKHMYHVFDCLERGQVVSEPYLRQCHKHLGISTEVLYHYKQVLNHSLKEFKVSDGLIFEILSILENFRAPLLNEDSYFTNLIEKNDFNSVVKRFAKNVQEDKLLENLFKTYPFEKLLLHCKIMLEFCLKGPSNYSSCDITPAHLNLKLTKHHYMAMRAAFERTLLESNFQEQDVLYILADLDYYKYDLCNEICLYEKLGGEKNIEHIVNSFYIKAFQNETLCSFFKNTDPVIMMKNQRLFFSNFFKAKTMKSCHFKDLRTFHLNMELKEEHFQFFVESMTEILKEIGIDDPELKKEVLGWLYRTKNDVLNKKKD